jgi:hypothetical protein
MRPQSSPTAAASSTSCDHLEVAGLASRRTEIGEPEKADLTFESSYDVACRIAQGTLNGRDAVTRKQMKADANIMRLMKFASIFTERHNAESTLEVAY